jgi:hypothetical protein
VTAAKATPKPPVLLIIKHLIVKIEEHDEVQGLVQA